MKALNWFLGAGQQIQMAIGVALITTIGLLIAGQVGTVWYFTGRVKDIQEKHDALVAKNSRCEGEVSGFRETTGLQNKAVDAMAEAARQRDEANAKAQAEARRRTAAAEARANAAANSKPLNADECISMEMRAERSIREFQEGRK